MAKAFSFIIQNDFFSHLKNLKEFELEWPIKISNTLPFEKILMIRNLIQEKGLKVPQRIFSMYYHHLFNEHVTDASKFEIFQAVMDNKFISIELVNEFNEYFRKYQKVYHGFCKLSYLWKLKSCKKEKFQDLCLNDLDTSSKNVITLLIDNHKFCYSLTDLVNIFQSSLTKLQYLIAMPLPVKNPYTNKEFPISVLYNFYFFLKNRLIHVPPLIEGFFCTGFDLTRFRFLYDNQIQDFALENYVRTSPFQYLKEGLFCMINEYTLFDDKVNIHPMFPEKKLFNVLRPYLFTYYKSKYSRTEEINRYYRRLLKKKLHEFFVFNPKFGTVSSYSREGDFRFNEKHLSPKKAGTYRTMTAWSESMEVLRETSLGDYRDRRGIVDINVDSDMTLSDSDTEETDSIIV